MSARLRAAALLAGALTLAAGGAAARKSRLDAAKGVASEKPLKAEPGMEWKGQHGGRATPGHGEIVDAKGWSVLWRELGLETPPTPDFSKYIVVIVYLGERPTGGYTVEFLEPKRDHDDLIVRYRQKEPGGFATQAFTQPWRMRLFAKPPGSLIVKSAGR